MTTILHVAPFDPSRYPPLINTAHVCAAAGIESVVVASLPVVSPGVLGGARIVAPSDRMGGGAQEAFLVKHAVALGRSTRPAMVVGHNARGLIAAAVAAPIARAPLVYHCHDFDGSGAINLRDTLLRAGEAAAARLTVEMWVPAGERLDIARERRLPGPHLLVRNCPRLVETLPPKGRLRAWLAQQGARGGGAGRVVTRHGVIGDAHYIRETIEALPPAGDDVIFVAIGDGDRDLIAGYRAAAARLGIADRVFFHPFVPHSELGSLLADGDAAMGVYVPSDVNTTTPAPNKVYENMALGVPVIVAAGNSVADDVLGVGAGLAVPVGSREALVEALRRLLDGGAFAEGCRRAAREAHLATYNYEVQLRPTRIGALVAAAR